MSDENKNMGDDISVTFWWTPDCGCMHVETDPATSRFGLVCPDGLSGWATADE